MEAKARGCGLRIADEAIAAAALADGDRQGTPIGRCWMAYHVESKRWDDTELPHKDKPDETTLIRGWEWRQCVLTPAPASAQPGPAAEQEKA